MADEVTTETPAEEVQAPVEAPEVPAEPVVEEAPVAPVEEAPAPSVEELAAGDLNSAAQAISDAPKTDGATKKINLRYNMKTYNTANGNYSFGPGEVSVPAEMAEDLLARDAEFDRIERAKHESIDLTVPVGEIHA